MPKTSLGTSVYGPDPSFAEGIGNIAEMFNPKAQAQGALMQAHSNYYGNAAQNASAQARLHAAEAAGIEDQNSAYADSVLADAGYTPMQRAAIRAARSKSVADIFKGVNLNTGATILQDPNGDKRVAMTLLGQGAAASNPNFSFTPEESNAVTLRNAFAKPVHVRDNEDLVQVNPDGSSNTLYQGSRILNPGQTAYDTTSTGLVPLVTAPTPPNTRGTDATRHALAVTSLQNRYKNNLIGSVSPLDDTKMNYKYIPDPDQINSITSYAIGLVQDGKVPAELALAESAKAHGVTLDFSSLDTATSKFKGFHLPVAPAPVVAPVAPVTSNLSNTVVGGSTANTNANTGGTGGGEGDNTDTTPTPAPESPTGMIRITNDAAGKAAWESLAPGTKYIAPDGKVLTKR